MVWVCYVSGLAYVAAHRGPEAFEAPRGPKAVQVCDFGPLAVRRALAEESDSGSGGGSGSGESGGSGGSEGSGSGGRERKETVTSVVAAESVVRVPGVFAQPVRTALPYRVRVRRVPHRAESTFDAVMLSEDAIVTVTSVRAAFLFLFLLLDRKSTRLNSSHSGESRMPSSA